MSPTAPPPVAIDVAVTLTADRSPRAFRLPLDRFAVFSGQMGTVPGTKRMQVRFDLLQRAAGGTLHPARFRRTARVLRRRNSTLSSRDGWKARRPAAPLRQVQPMR